MGDGLLMWERRRGAFGGWFLTPGENSLRAGGSQKKMSVFALLTFLSLTQLAFGPKEKNESSIPVPLKHISRGFCC